jgi:hypothetical protein
MAKQLLISNSEIQTWKDCRRKWWLVYYREMAPRRDQEDPTGARQLGIRIHIALGAMYQDGLNPVEVLRSIYAEDEAALTAAQRTDRVTALRKEYDLALAMIEGYVEWVAETAVDEGLELVATEDVIEVPGSVPGVTLRGKLDARFVRKVDRARLFLDHKTVGDLTTPQRILPMDEQMKFYHLLEQLDGMYRGVSKEKQWRTDGALYNMLRKVKRTATAKPPFYERVEVRHNRAVIESTWKRVHKVCEEIVAAHSALDAGADHQYVCPPRPSRDCTWKCDFQPICAMFDDGSNVEGLMDEYYEHRDPHERYAKEDEEKAV